MHQPVNTISHRDNKPSIAIIGGGPAGLMAAEVLLRQGLNVALYDAMPSVGRKFLMAGKGGMNISHSEQADRFCSRYHKRTKHMTPLLTEFGQQHLLDWIHELGVETFVGTSGRVFPREMKAAPLLRKWLHRLRQQGLQIKVRHRWDGWDENGHIVIMNQHSRVRINPDAIILALGGGSWTRLGSTGTWVDILRNQGVKIADLRPANCGFNRCWSDFFISRFAGAAIKSVSLSISSTDGETHCQQGDFNVTEHGIEGGLIYALSATIRERMEISNQATVYVDLTPDISEQKLIEKLSQSRGKNSLSNHIRKKAGITGVKASLLRELATEDAFNSAAGLAAAIKNLPLTLVSPRPLEEAISSAGGVPFSELDSNLMLNRIPGVFCAGEMLDWEAPTGGYLLTACFSTGHKAGQGVLNWLTNDRHRV